MIKAGCLLVLILMLISPIMLIGKLLGKLGINIGSILLATVQKKFYDIWDYLCSPFRPKPVESEIEDPDYYHPTEERDKRYDNTDGEYTNYKKVK